MWHLLKYLVGLGLLAAYGGLLAFVEDGSARPPLSVTLSAGSQGVIAAEVQSTRPVRLRIDGVTQPKSNQVATTVPSGLHTVTWSTSYMGKPSRSVSYSYMTGPYVQDGWVRNAARVAINAAALDDDVPGRGGDLADALAKVIQRYLEQHADLRKYAGQVMNVRVGIRANSYHIAVALEALFVDARGQSSRLLGGLRLTPRIRQHKLSFARTGPVVAHIQGAARTRAQSEGASKVGIGGLLVGLGLALLDGGATLGTVLAAGGVGAGVGSAVGRGVGDKELNRRLDAAAQSLTRSLIPKLNSTLGRFLSSQVRLELQHGNLSFQWRPSELILRRSGMALLFDVKVEASNPSHGWPQTSLGAPVVGAGLAGTPVLLSNVRVDLSANLVNVLSDRLWRNGLLDDAINRPTVLGRLSTPEVRDLLAFTIQGVRFNLPPSISRWSSGSVKVNVGGVDVDLRATECDPRIPKTVTLHGALTLKSEVQNGGSALLLTVEPAPLLAGCGSGVPSNPLRPCLSDFIGVANSMLAEEGAFRFDLSLGALVQSRSFGVGSARLIARVKPVSIGIEEGDSPSVRADLSFYVSAR